MIRKFITIYLIFVCLTLFSQHEIRVTFTDLESVEGNLRVALYDGPDYFPEDTGMVRHLITPVTDNTMEIIFNNLPSGEYGIAMLHDANSDGECNFNFIGIPKEGFGFSNVEGIIFKEPSFDRVKFSVDKDTELQIKVLSLF